MIEWIAFSLIVLFLPALDLLVINKRAHKIEFSEALKWSIMWILISCAFGVFVYYDKGTDAGNQWFTAYIIEKSLSMDNLFVMLLIFQYFNTPANIQHTALFWGILGAIVLRGVFIFLGATIVSAFHPVLYVFGAILVYSGIKMFFVKDENPEVKENIVVKFFRKHFRVVAEYDGKKFFVKRHQEVTGGGKVGNVKVTFKGHFMKRFATLLFITVLMIETTDIVFAVDSIPAAFCITTDTFILYTSNIFAVLGLRALFFVLAAAVDKLWALKYGISIILIFIGTKMLTDKIVEMPTSLSLLMVVGILVLSGVLSVIYKPQKA